MENQPQERTVTTTTVVKETFAPPPDVSTPNVPQERKEPRLDPELWGEASIPPLFGLKMNTIISNWISSNKYLPYFRK